MLFRVNEIQYFFKHNLCNHIANNKSFGYILIVRVEDIEQHRYHHPDDTSKNSFSHQTEKGFSDGE